MDSQSVTEPEITEEETSKTTTDGEIIGTEVGEELATQVRNGADALDMVEFTEPSGLGVHGHAPATASAEGKHDIRIAFNVRDEFILEHFEKGVVPNGHEAVHALLIGRERFIESDEDIFTDVPDTHEARWDKIRTVAGRAPIPPGRKSQLKQLYNA